MLGATSKNILLYCQISVRSENYHYDHVGYVRKFFVIKTKTRYFPLIIKGCFPSSSWRSRFELVRLVFSYATDRQNTKTPKTLLRWERIKSGKDFPLKKCLIFQKKNCNDFVCCRHFTVPRYISCFLVLFKFVFFNYWHIALMQKNRQMNSLFWRHVREIRKVEMTGN